MGMEEGMKAAMAQIDGVLAGLTARQNPLPLLGEREIT